MGHFCELCGRSLYMEGVGFVPFHSDNMESVAQDALSPYCTFCGKTLRQGFVKRVTCQCEVSSEESD